MIAMSSYIGTVFLISIRLSMIVFIIPLQIVLRLPFQTRLYFLLAFAVIFYPFVKPLVFDSELSLIISAFAELINGLILSLSLLAALGVFHIAGQLIDTQMGLNALAILNPSEHSFEPLMSRFYTILAVVLFFISNGHSYLFKAFFLSLHIIPLGTLITLQNSSLIVQQFSTMFYFALIIASPILISVLLIDTSAAVLSKTMPNINIYFLMLPIKILLSYGLIILFLPNYPSLINQVFAHYFQVFQRVLS